MRRYNLKEFELSQSYLFFWDKLEKANYFLEQILDTTGEELDGRLVQALMSNPVGDGGQWDMVANLVEKYGLVSNYIHTLTLPSKPNETFKRGSIWYCCKNTMSPWRDFTHVMSCTNPLDRLPRASRIVPIEFECGSSVRS